MFWVNWLNAHHRFHRSKSNNKDGKWANDLIKINPYPPNSFIFAWIVAIARKSNAYLLSCAHYHLISFEMNISLQWTWLCIRISFDFKWISIFFHTVAFSIKCSHLNLVIVEWIWLKKKLNTKLLKTSIKYHMKMM